MNVFIGINLSVRKSWDAQYSTLHLPERMRGGGREKERERRVTKIYWPHFRKDRLALTKKFKKFG